MITITIEKTEREQRIDKLKRAVELGEAYERTYAEEMDLRREIRQKQEDAINEFMNMTDLEYLEYVRQWEKIKSKL